MTYIYVKFKSTSFSPLFLQILPGNSNTYEVSNNTLNPAIFATKIRILPYSEHPRTVCIRAELVGCRFSGKNLSLQRSIFVSLPWLMMVRRILRVVSEDIEEGFFWLRVLQCQGCNTALFNTTVFAGVVAFVITRVRILV